MENKAFEDNQEYYVETAPGEAEIIPEVDGYAYLGSIEPKNEIFDLKSNQAETRRPNFENAPFLSEEEAKEALAKFVSEHCCYGKGPVKNLIFQNLQSSHTFRYLLKTYTETRFTANVNVPYNGPIIYRNGPAPQPWDILVEPTALFINQAIKLEIPNTFTIQNCNNCIGSGFRTCHRCSGSGKTHCFSCHGSGRVLRTSHSHHSNHTHHHTHASICFSCAGTGRRSCFNCNSTGRVECHVCKGCCKLKWFVQLTVEFKCNEDDFFKKSQDIPDELVRNCEAKVIFAEQNNRLYPINHHSDPEINKASYDLLNSHANKFYNCRIFAQRHEIYAIPVTNCVFKWKDEPYKYQVYGIENKVYAPDYPQKCCACTIL